MELFGIKASTRRLWLTFILKVKKKKKKRTNTVNICLWSGCCILVQTAVIIFCQYKRTVNIAFFIPSPSQESSRGNRTASQTFSKKDSYKVAVKRKTGKVGAMWPEGQNPNLVTC